MTEIRAATCRESFAFAFFSAAVVLYFIGIPQYSIASSGLAITLLLSVIVRPKL